MNFFKEVTSLKSWSVVIMLGIAVVALIYFVIRDARRCKKCGSWKSKVIEKRQYVIGDTATKNGVVVGTFLVLKRICSNCDNEMSSNPPLQNPTA